MNAIKKVWRPQGLPQQMEEVLSVAPPPPGGQMARPVYLSLLRAKIEHLIQEDVSSAKAAMQMSSESAPEMWAIASSYPSSEWAAAIVSSDAMNQRLKNLRSEGVLMDPPDPPTTLREILEQL